MNLTAGQLKKMLQNVPDDVPVMREGRDHSYVELYSARVIDATARVQPDGRVTEYFERDIDSERGPYYKKRPIFLVR